MAILVQSNKKPSVSFPEQTGSIVTFNAQYALPLKSHTVDIDSVSGVSAIHIQNTCGVNQWDEEYLDGYYDRNNQGVFVSNRTFFCSKDFIAVLPNDQLFWYAENPQHEQGRMLFYDANGNYISATEANSANTVINVPNNAYKMHFYLVKYNGTTIYNVSINKPSTDTSYHAFMGQSFDISIGQTVNEATYNARTGVLEVTQPSVQTIQLPPCPIDTLQGVNNIWADTGETTVQYIKIGG